jgi:acyl-CoA thioesterase-1
MNNIALFWVALIASLTVVNTAEKKTDPKKTKKAAPNPAFAKVEDKPGLPRVLLIGDSISIGYTVDVQNLLKDKANVHRIPGNGGPTINGLKNLKTWLGDTKWDVIHFNWGLHDLKYVGPDNANLADPKLPTSRQQVSLAEYEKNLAELVKQMQATGAKLIWRTTTPVPEGSSGRIAGDEVKYNEVAARVMKAQGIMTDDLYAHAMVKLKEIQRPANVHFTEEGSRYLAKQVAAIIESQLPRK